MMRLLIALIVALVATAFGVYLTLYMQVETELQVKVSDSEDLPAGTEDDKDIGEGTGFSIRPVEGSLSLEVLNKGPQAARNLEVSFEVIMLVPDTKGKPYLCQLLDRPRTAVAAHLGTNESLPIRVRHTLLRKEAFPIVGMVEVCMARDGILPFDRRFTRARAMASHMAIMDQVRANHGERNEHRVKSLDKPEITKEYRDFFVNYDCASWMSRIRGGLAYPVCSYDPSGVIHVR